MKKKTTRKPVKKTIARDFNLAKATPAQLWARDIEWGVQAASGERVTPNSTLGISAIYAGVRAISEDISCLPLHVFTDTDEGREKADKRDTLQSLIDWPNDLMTSQEFKQTLTAHALLWGNGYAAITRDLSGQPRELNIMLPQDVQVKAEGSNIYYLYHIQGPEYIRIEKENVLHLKGYSPDGIMGYCIASVLKQPLGNAQSLDKVSGGFFMNGMSPSAVMTHPKHLSPEAASTLKESIVTQFTGNANFGKLLLLEEGMTIQPWSMNAEQGQLLEQKQFSVQECSRIMRIPSHMISDLTKSAFSNIENQGQDYVNYTLLGWATRWEQTLNMRLIPKFYNRYFKFNFNGLLRGDSTTRASFYKAMQEVGAFSPNDIREREDLNKIPNGDVYFISNNVKPIEQAIKPTLPETGDKPKEEKPKVDEVQRTALKLMASDNIERSLRAEWKRKESGKHEVCTVQDISRLIDKPCRAIAAIYGKPVDSILERAISNHMQASNSDLKFSEEEWLNRAMSEAENIIKELE